MTIDLQLIHGTATAHIEVSDRGLQYGDGFFTTSRVNHGKVELWPLHLQRLTSASARLAIGPIDWPLLEAEVMGLAAPLVDGVIKIVVTRGAGGRGYSPQGCDQPTVIVSHFPLPAHCQRWQEQGISLAVAGLPLAISPALAGLKSLNRLEQVLGKQEIERLQVDDALFCNSEGHVIESNAANLFWRSGQLVYTPDLSLSGVDGVMRRRVLQLLSKLGIPCQVVTVPPEVVAEADEIWLTNSVQHLVPVAEFAGKRFSDFSMTRTIQGLLMDGVE